MDDSFAYYSLDDILADAEPIPVIFQYTAQDLGFLDEQSMDELHLAQDSRVEVPLWLATTLAIRSYVTLELPRVFQPAFREMLLADPTVVDLHSKCSYFYEFGIKIATLISQPDLGHTLCKSMNVRYLEIVKRTANRKQNESLEFMSRLANMERQLFDSKAAGLLQLKKLHDRSSVQLCIAPVLAALQSYANSAANAHAQSNRAHGGAAAASTSERRLTTNATRGRDPNALRNITNAQGGVGGGATQATPHPTKPVSSLPASTLARLKESSENNRPLASHESMRFGMAATQARQAAKAAFESTQAPPPTATQTMPTAQSRKRKSVQNK